MVLVDTMVVILFKCHMIDSLLGSDGDATNDIIFWLPNVPGDIKG